MMCEQHRTEWEKALETGLVGPTSNSIRLSRYRWLSILESNSAEFPDYMLLDIVPFAKGLDGGWVGWIADCKNALSPVVLSPRDEEFAMILGSRIGDGLYYLLVDELMDCWLQPTDYGKTIWNLETWLPLLQCGLLVEQQISSLRQIARQTPTKTRGGGAAFLSQADLPSFAPGFPLFDEARRRIRQYASI